MQLNEIGLSGVYNASHPNYIIEFYSDTGQVLIQESETESGVYYDYTNGQLELTSVTGNNFIEDRGEQNLLDELTSAISELISSEVHLQS